MMEQFEFGGETYLLTTYPDGSIEMIERLGDQPAVIEEGSRLHLAVSSAFYNQTNL
jgi:hypothetical protein